MSKLTGSICASMALALIAGRASAAVITVTASGVLAPSAVDTLRVFAKTGSTDLAGTPFTETAVFNDMIPGAVSQEDVTPGGTPFETELSGLGVSNPLVSASLTIDGTTLNWALFGDSFIARDPLGVLVSLEPPGPTASYSVFERVFPGGPVSLDYHDPVNFVPGTPGSFAFGSFDFEQFNPRFQDESLEFDIQKFQVTSVGPAAPFEVVVVPMPEPETWTLLTLGTAMIGFVLRTGRRFRPGRRLRHPA